MMAPFLKRITTLSMLVLFSATFCMTSISAKKAHCKDDKFGCGSDKHRTDFIKDCKLFKDCVERELANKLKNLESELVKKFCEQNKLVCTSVETLTACLQDFFDTHKNASNAHLKDFITHSLDKTEGHIEDFISQKIHGLKEDLCALFKEVNCNLDLLACKVDDVASDIDCIANVLLDFLTVANGVNFLNGALDAAIAAANDCLNTNDNCLVACCEEPDNGCEPVL